MISRGGPSKDAPPFILLAFNLLPSADHPELELLKLKEIAVMHTVTDKELVSSSVVQASAAIFKTMKPFLDYLGSMLPPMA